MIAPSFTEDAVRTMLLAAKVKRLARPDALTELAEMLQSAAEMAQGPPDDGGHSARMKRAQVAIDELRRVLPDLAATFWNMAEHPSPLADENAPDRLRKYAATATAIYGLTEGIDWGPSAKKVDKLFYEWPFSAAGIYLAYRSVVGHASTSKNGPAVRFVELALKATGWNEHTTDAIESALRKHPLTAKR